MRGAVLFAGAFAVARAAVCTHEELELGCVRRSRAASGRACRHPPPTHTHTPPHPHPALRPSALTCDAAEPSWVKYFSVAAAGPEQVNINYGKTPDAMVVGWMSPSMSDASFVEFGTASGAPYARSASGSSAQYVYGPKYTSGAIHHVTLTRLAPATKYFYRVGTNASWSQEFSFTSNRVGKNYPYGVGVYADVGESTHAMEVVTHLIEGAAAGYFDSFLLAGDISYASGCESKGCGTWDAFQRMIQPLAAYYPHAVEMCVRARRRAAPPLGFRRPLPPTPRLTAATTRSTTRPTGLSRSARVRATRGCHTRRAPRTTSTTSRITRARRTSSRWAPSTRAASARAAR